MKQTNGVIPQVVHNPSTEDLYILKGTVTGYVTPHTLVPAEEVVGELHTRNKAADTVNSCEQATDTEDFTAIRPALVSPVAALMAKLTGFTIWQSQLMVVVWIATILMAGAMIAVSNSSHTTALVAQGEDWACSMQHEEDASKKRQTTVNHRPVTTLPRKDGRRMESGSMTVARIMKELKQTRHAAHYKGWKEQIAAQFTFGKKLREEEKDELLCLLYAYRDMFTLTPKAPPLIEGIEHALYFRYDDPFPVRRKIPKLSQEQMTHMSKDTKQLLRDHIIQFSDSEWATVPVFAKKKADPVTGVQSLRFCLDFRALNDLLISDSQALPDIPTTLQSLGAAKRYSAFDACAGF